MRTALHDSSNVEVMARPQNLWVESDTFSLKRLLFSRASGSYSAKKSDVQIATMKIMDSFSNVIKRPGNELANIPDHRFIASGQSRSVGFGSEVRRSEKFVHPKSITYPRKTGSISVQTIIRLRTSLYPWATPKRIGNVAITTSGLARCDKPNRCLAVEIRANH